MNIDLNTPEGVATWVWLSQGKAGVGGGRLPKSVQPAPSVTLALPPPPSANALWRSVVVGGRVRVLRSREYRQWIRVAMPLAKAAGSVASPVAVRLTLAGVHRGRDGDNFQKPVLDLLREAGVIAGDNLTHVVEGSWRYEGGGDPRVVVVVEGV